MIVTISQLTNQNLSGNVDGEPDHGVNRRKML